MLGNTALAQAPLGGFPPVQSHIIGIETVTDTTILQLPINCVLAGQQEYEQGGYDVEYVGGSYREFVSVSCSEVWQGDSPTFTTRTDSRGYD